MTLSIDHYAHLSRWRERPVLEKALLAIGMLLLAISLPPLPAAPCIIASVLSVTLLGARVPLRLWLRYALIPAGFLLTAGLSMLFDVSHHGLSLSPAALPTVCGLLLRSFAGICCLLLLALTTPVTDILASLRKIGLPREIAEISLIMYRLVFLLLDTASAMHTAQAARLGQSNRKQQLRSLGLLLANLFPRAMDRAGRMENGLAARGWNGEFNVLRHTQPLSPTRLTWTSLLLGSVLLIGTLFS